MVETHNLTAKTIKVFKSCESLLQIQTALNFAYLVQKRISTELNIPYEDVNKELQSVMEKQNFNPMIKSCLILL